jgi:hypothetical protein
MARPPWGASVGAGRQVAHCREAQLRDDADDVDDTDAEDESPDDDAGDADRALAQAEAEAAAAAPAVVGLKPTTPLRRVLTAKAAWAAGATYQHVEAAAVQEFYSRSLWSGTYGLVVLVCVLLPVVGVCRRRRRPHRGRRLNGRTRMHPRLAPLPALQPVLATMRRRRRQEQS